MRDVRITWEGREYRIPEDKLFELMEEIERHIILPDLLLMIGSGRPNFSALARPLHALLTHAGVRDVPSLLDLRARLVGEGFSGLTAGKNAAETATGQAMAALGALTVLLMDGAPDLGGGEAKEPGKRKPRSSSPATRSRSANGA